LHLGLNWESPPRKVLNAVKRHWIDSVMGVCHE
jgi:hypothetical protein